MPLLKALLCQLLALACLLAIYRWWPFSIEIALSLQAVLAAVFSRLWWQPLWWLPIHLLFVPLLWLALAASLPAWLYLAGFLLMLLLFWGTVKGDVPLFLSSPAVVEAVIDIVEREQAMHFVDVGAGIGTVVAPLAQRLPRLKISAWELAPLTWLLAVCRCWRLCNVDVKRVSFWQCNLAEFDVVFAFLSPLVMPRLAEKARREMRPGTLLVSSSFPVPEWLPEAVLQSEDRRGSLLYCYRI